MNAKVASVRRLAPLVSAQGGSICWRNFRYPRFSFSNSDRSIAPRLGRIRVTQEFPGFEIVVNRPAIS